MEPMRVRYGEREPLPLGRGPGYPDHFHVDVDEAPIPAVAVPPILERGWVQELHQGTHLGGDDDEWIHGAHLDFGKDHRLVSHNGERERGVDAQGHVRKHARPWVEFLERDGPLANGETVEDEGAGNGTCLGPPRVAESGWHAVTIRGHPDYAANLLRRLAGVTRAHRARKRSESGRGRGFENDRRHSP